MAQRYHVFSLPPELLETLTPRNLISRPPPPEASTLVQTTPPVSDNARACNICLGATFADVTEQRTHFRSDWHRYNVKIRLRGGSPVTEPAFAQLVDGLEDSISGSASSDESSDDSDAVKALVSKIKRTSRSPSPSEERKTPLTAVSWFHSPPSTQIGVYRMLFPIDTPPPLYLAELKSIQERVKGGRKWAMFMVAGGHFAGAIVEVSRPAENQDSTVSAKSKKKPPKPKPETSILKHKTFHRYTTRRKQGGSQSVNDNSKGAAISAGAMLRRYGEQALRDDIRNLLFDWADDIQDCERIWLRASVSNRRIFLDYENCVINKGDDRLRTFPFPTRRPTQSELVRCLLELTQVKTSHLTEEALLAQDEAFLASLPKPKTTPFTAPTAAPEKAKPQRLTKEEEAYREKWSRLLDMISKGRSEPLRSFWEREGASLGGVDAPIPEWTGDRRASLLQVAVQSGHEDVTRLLLYDLHADPTIIVPSSGVHQEDKAANESDASDAPPLQGAGSRRTAYDLARTRAVRDIFRQCAGDHPDWWDWFGAARVPSTFNKEKEDARDEKKKQRKKGLKEKMREREAREREREGKQFDMDNEQVGTKSESRSQDPTAPRKLGGSSGAADSVLGLTVELRAKVERERRARAAEARLKTLTGARQ
ncbi:uncharacterized protein BJ212DRAFT_1393488 [Suillus subaureus]|uniref:VLRF1 domain-containing protein n=1 Tax=Suillus subaureus TaxID=48587 RepID=A0A9P7J5R0_9AGAM|nr:uncharacterized protein BJ212DRAFT_1393488 [Suillus subaureus]KAG1804509.1 hypothetical protein BJ212DRAFT_1393488 [Suillus subaureus]